MPSTTAFRDLQLNGESTSVLIEYTVDDKRAVCAFLAKNRDVEQALIDGREQFRRIFGARCTPRVEIFKDPEMPAAPDEVWVIVKCNSSVDDALMKLDSLRRDWLVKLPRDIRSRIRADVDTV